MKNYNNYTVLDFLAICHHNGDYEAAQAEIDAIDNEPYVRDSEEDFEDYYNTCVKPFIKD